MFFKEFSVIEKSRFNCLSYFIKHPVIDLIGSSVDLLTYLFQFSWFIVLVNACHIAVYPYNFFHNSRCDLHKSTFFTQNSFETVYDYERTHIFCFICVGLQFNSDHVHSASNFQVNTF